MHRIKSKSRVKFVESCCVSASRCVSGIVSDGKWRERVGGMVCLPHLVRWAMLDEVL
jgi:hypothetical protein